MPGHWKKMMDDKELLQACDLDGRDVTITIEKVVGGEVRGDNNKKNKKPVASIKGKTKKLVLNVTNCRTIEALTGTPDPAEWAGIRITIFPTTTDFGGKTVECIRVRPHWPKEKPNGKGDAKGKDVRALSDQIAEKMVEDAAGGYDPESTAAIDEAGNASSLPGPDDDIPEVGSV